MSHSADIARIAMLSPQAVNVIIRSLEKRKLIERMPHKTHGRILVTRLPPEGEACWAQCRSKVDALEKTVCQPLSPETEKTIREWLVYIKTTLANDHDGRVL
jgi:DNA-binding MarR family transcriptional regulator